MKDKEDDLIECVLDEETWSFIDKEARVLGITPEAFISKCIRDQAGKVTDEFCAKRSSVRYPPAKEA